MIDRRPKTLRARVSSRPEHFVESETVLDRQKAVAAPFPTRNLGVDRIALTRFIVILMVFFIAYLAVALTASESGRDFLNAVGPLALCLASLWTGSQIVLVNPRTIWTPMPWFALSTALFFGLGPLAYVFGSEASIAFMDAFWPVASDDLWRTNLLNTVSLLTISTAFLIADKLLEIGQGMGRLTPRAFAGGNDPARTAAFVFLGAGLPLRYLLVLPYRFGQLSFTLPRSLYTLDCLVNLGLFMLAYLGVKRGGLWKSGFWLLLVAETITNFVSFSKEQLLLVFIMVALGRFLAKRNVREFIFAGLATLGIYFLVSPLVAWGRMRIERETGDFNQAPLGLRLTIAAQGLELWSRGALDIDHSHQARWTRLCYASPQTAAMHLYDSGYAGDSFALALSAWVPRLLWPDKPIVTVGEDFTELILGRRGTCTGIGIFGEAYWNGGWPMVILACGYVGVLFAWLSRTALVMLARSEWLLLPCAFIGIRLGLRLDDWFVGYIIGFLLYLMYYFIIRLVMGNDPNRGEEKRLYHCGT